MEKMISGSKLSQKSTIILLFLLNLILVMPLLLGAVKQRQEIRKKAEGEGTVRLTLTPSSGNYQTRESFTVSVQLTNQASQSWSIRVAGATLSFNPSVLTIDQLSCGTSFPAPALPPTGSTPPVPGFGVVSNKIYLTCFRYQNGAPLSPLPIQPGETVVLGSFQITVKNDAPVGNSQIAFTRTNVPESQTLVNIADAGTPGVYTISGTTTPIPTATPSPGTTPGQVKIRLQVKFKGVDQQRIDQLVKILVKQNNSLVQTLSTTSFSANQQGIYQSPLLVLSSQVSAGSNYFLSLKGPKHLANKYGPVTLSAGENQFNLTNPSLLPGDLPHPQYGQDGVVNAFDAVLLVNCLATPEKQTCLDQADLNLDNIINSFDMNLINLTLSGNRWQDE